MEICKIAFFCEYQYFRFLKSQQIFSGALEFSFDFKSLLWRLKNTVLSKKVKIDFFGEKCLQDLHFNSKKFGRSFWCQNNPF